MVRHLICLMLIPLVLANQAIALGCPHQHSGSHSNSQDNLTHIHIGLHGNHKHAHHDGDHDAKEHGHRAKQESECPDDEGSEESWQGSGESCDHDCDAIYISVHELRFLPSAYKIDVGAAIFWVAFYLLEPIWTYSQLDQIQHFALHGPFSQNRCAIYLQILCLRI